MPVRGAQDVYAMTITARSGVGSPAVQRLGHLVAELVQKISASMPSTSVTSSTSVASPFNFTPYTPQQA